MSRILITGSRAPIALDLGRALTRAGFDVHVADVRPNRMLGAFPQHRYASPVHAPMAFAADIVRLAAQLAPDLIVPMCEEVFHLAYVAQSQALPLYAPPLDVLIRLHSKFGFIDWARGLGLDAPTTERVTWRVSPASRDGVYKPEFSRFGTRVHMKLDAKVAEFINQSVRGAWVRQAYVPGDDISFHALARDGHLTAFAAYRSDWRTIGGASYHFQPLDDDLARRVRDIAVRLIGAGRLTGQIACDLRHDPDGRLWLIECNPRATSGLHLLTHDPHALGRALLTSDDECLKADPDPACVGLAMIAYGAPKAWRTGSIRRWRADAQARDVLAGAKAGALADSLGYAIAAALRGQSLPAFLTHDIEFNGWRE